MKYNYCSSIPGRRYIEDSFIGVYKVNVLGRHDSTTLELLGKLTWHGRDTIGVVYLDANHWLELDTK